MSLKSVKSREFLHHNEHRTGNGCSSILLHDDPRATEIESLCSPSGPSRIPSYDHPNPLHTPHSRRNSQVGSHVTRYRSDPSTINFCHKGASSTSGESGSHAPSTRQLTLHVKRLGYIVATLTFFCSVFLGTVIFASVTAITTKTRHAQESTSVNSKLQLLHRDQNNVRVSLDRISDILQVYGRHHDKWSDHEASLASNSSIETTEEYIKILHHQVQSILLILNAVVTKMNAVQRHQGCPTGFEHAQQFKSCYRLMTKKRSWAEARQRCQSLGADLVALTTKKKNDYFVDVAIKANFRNEIFWTSGRLIEPGERIPEPPGYYPGSTAEASLLGGVDPPAPASSSSVYASPVRSRPGGRNASVPDLSFVGDKRNWVWYSTGRTIRLRNWVQGNPRLDPAADCIELNTANYKWASFSCAAKFRFICEINYEA